MIKRSLVIGKKPLVPVSPVVDIVFEFGKLKDNKGTIFIRLIHDGKEVATTHNSIIFSDTIVTLGDIFLSEEKEQE